MIGILARCGQLSAFVESLDALPRPDGVDISVPLNFWFMRDIGVYISEGSSISGLEHLLGGIMPEAQERVCLENIGGFGTATAALLLEAIYDARSDILKTHSQIPNLGYPAIFIVLLWHLCLTPSDHSLLTDAKGNDYSILPKFFDQ
ncbi:hypothetical protein BDV93DRAFT_527524 [Ceratobasidium sp. AG-I]|nr:hypothetical protein BDV93DRAFT_527524 [Ceratobasidium sp. AG-I]